MIVFKNVSKIFPNGGCGVKNLSFEVNKGEILTLLGPSGSGKTTTLRLINRLTDPDSGQIFFDGEDIVSLDPIELRRKIGYAVQHIGLFPHMTVGENVGIVPKLIGWPEKKIAKRVSELLEMVGLGDRKFREISPARLSGGQKQRIGVARALAADPPVILMDEPFGALDPLSREQLQNEFLEIQSKIRKAVVFITHDLNEAVKIGDRIAILDKGELIQIATPQEFIENPSTSVVNRFLGKDRFHLLLQTKQLKAFSKELKKFAEPSSSFSLDLSSSLMEVFSTFALENQDLISVYDKNHYIGVLSKQAFIEGVCKKI